RRRRNSTVSATQCSPFARRLAPSRTGAWTRQGEQSLEERPPHRRRPRRRVEQALFARGRLLSGGRLPGRQILAVDQPGGQYLRRPQPRLLLPADGNLYQGGGIGLGFVI